MSWTIVISHSPVQVRVEFDTIFNQCMALFANPFRSKNVRSIDLKTSVIKALFPDSFSDLHNQAWSGAIIRLIRSRSRPPGGSQKRMQQIALSRKLTDFAQLRR